MFFTLFSLASSISRANPTPFAPRGHVKSHAHEEMAFVYTEMQVFLALLVQERSYKDSVGHRHSAGNMKLFHAKMKVNTCTVCEIGLFTEEEEDHDVEQIGVLAIPCVSLLLETTIETDS